MARQLPVPLLSATTDPNASSVAVSMFPKFPATLRTTVVYTSVVDPPLKIPLPRLDPPLVFPMIVEFTADTEACWAFGTVAIPPPTLLLTVELVMVRPGLAGPMEMPPPTPLLTFESTVELVIVIKPCEAIPPPAALARLPEIVVRCTVSGPAAKIPAAVARRVAPGDGEVLRGEQTGAVLEEHVVRAGLQDRVPVSVDGHGIGHRGRPLQGATTRAVGQHDVGLRVDLRVGGERGPELGLVRDRYRRGRARQPDEHAPGDDSGDQERESRAVQHPRTVTSKSQQWTDR